MKLEKLSASSLQVSETCLSRFKAERDAPRDSAKKQDYALLGSTCHDTLENYVRTTVVEKSAEPDRDLLHLFYQAATKRWFGKIDKSSSTYKDGLDLVNRWYDRTDFGYFTVLSLESKEHFNLPTSAGDVKFTYIIDRLDKLENNVYRVVDYKTSREYLTPDGLLNKIQAKIYALAVQIKFPEAKEIHVQFDMLRHNGPVGIILDRNDNIETWRTLKAAAERIVEAPEDNPPETLNDQCLFCIKKTTCSAVTGNISAGGLYGRPIEELVEARTLIAFQQKAARAALSELDAQILEYMEEFDVFEISTNNAVAEAKISYRRSVNASEVRDVVGEEVFNRYGSDTISMKNLDALLASDEITVAQRVEIDKLIERVPSEPRVDTKLKGAFDA